ncbi:MAG: TVP38/TMEM64 family protein [Blastochloris sp.]|nr:TVP38/TMEM64 family protein [Blastochloris sp.]
MACSNRSRLGSARTPYDPTHMAPDTRHATAIRRLRRIVMWISLLGALGAYLWWPGVRAEMNRGALLLMRGDVAAVRDYLLSFGIWAPVVSALLMVLQALIAPLPAFLLAFANGLAFGVGWGSAVTFSSALLAASLSFWIGRGLGRNTVEALVGKAGLRATDAWFTRYGPWAVLIARLMPITSFDLISYAAGLSAMRFRWFLAATAVGIAPATVIYAFLGEQAPQAIWVVFIAFGIVIVTAIPVAMIRHRHKRVGESTPE